jgi:hypothetical protein
MKVLRHLAPAAEHERDQRAATYPDYVRRGLISEADAQADYQAWCAIALWCAGETVAFAVELEAETLLRWDPARREMADQRRQYDWPSEAEIMETAARRAVEHLATLRAAKPDDTALAARAAKVSAIRDGVQRYRQFCESMTRELRARARDESKAAA